MGVDKETGIWDLNTAKKRHRFDETLAKKIAELYQPILAADLGCGRGEYCKTFKEQGWNIHGYEGTPDIKEIAVYKDITVLDLTKRRWVGIDYDLVLCLEIGEHIPKIYEQVFINNVLEFTHRGLILSWAIPGQGGSGHFNEQGNDYVIGKFVEAGLVHDKERSEVLRKSVSLKWFKNTIMVFRRK